MNSLTRPRLYSVMDEIKRHVPDMESRRLIVEIGFDDQVQALLEQAATEALNEIERIVPRMNHPEDQVLVDAVVIDHRGGIVARMGLENIPSGKASEIKPEIYGLALERKTLHSMGDVLPKGMTAERALVISDNEQAKKLAQRVGLSDFERHLRDQGFSVTGPFPSITIGAGVAGSPRISVGVFAKFGYMRPGWCVGPNLLVHIRDATTGEVLFEPPFTEVFSHRTTLQVRRALEKVSLVGTSRVLAPLARAAPIAAKTGTSGFRKRDGAWQGNGGSWCLAADSRIKKLIAVRVRWASGRPFEINGGQSATLVVRNFIARLRAHEAASSMRRRR